MIEIPLIVGILIGLFAGWKDLKTGYVDRRYIAALVCFGLIYWGLFSLFYWNLVYILGSCIIGLWFFCVGFVMWKLSGWGGGDWLLFTGYGFLLPFLKSGLFIYPISFLMNLAVVGGIYLIVYLGLRICLNPELISRVGWVMIIDHKLFSRIRFTIVFPITLLIYGVWGDLFIILLNYVR